MNENNTRCPAFARLAIAEAMLEKYAHLHSDLEATRAHLKLMRESLELVHGLLPCEPAINDQGHLLCPLDMTADGARWLALENRFVYQGVALETVLTGEAPSVPIGAML
jgi:hypothetical protein